MKKTLTMLVLFGFPFGVYANPALEQLKENSGIEALDIQVPAPAVRPMGENKTGRPDFLTSSAFAVDKALRIAETLSSNGDSRVKFETDRDESIRAIITKAGFRGVNPKTGAACSINVKRYYRTDLNTYVLSLHVTETDPRSGRHGCDDSLEHAAYGECMRDLRAPSLGAVASYTEHLRKNDKDTAELRRASTVPYFLGTREEAAIGVSDEVLTLSAKFTATPFRQAPGSDEVFNWNNVRSSDSMACEFKVK